MNVARSLLVLCACVAAADTATSQETLPAPPGPAQRSIDHLEAKLQWVADEHAAARQHTLERQAALLTGNRASDVQIERQIRLQLTDLEKAHGEIVKMAELVEDGIDAIRQADAAGDVADVSRTWHDRVDKQAAAICRELARLEDLYQPLAEPRKPFLPPAALGQAAVPLAQAESDEVEDLVRNALFEPWLEFHMEQGHRRSTEAKRINQSLRSMDAAVENAPDRVKYEYRTHFRRGKVGDQVIDRVRGKIELRRQGRIGAFGALTSRSSVLAFRYEPADSPTLAIRGEMQLLLVKPLALDLRDLPAQSLLTRVQSHEWHIQYPPGFVPPAPGGAAGQ